MLSDGIADKTESDEDAHLIQLISENRCKCASDICETILSDTITRFGAADDMSVVAIRVDKAD